MALLAPKREPISDVPAPPPEKAEAVRVARSEVWFLGLVLLIGLLPRLYLLTASHFGIESDEAIVGLMAKHIVEGRAWPVFYYGQAYMGSLEAFFVAGAFAVLGQSNAALKLVPLLFSLLHIGLVYGLAKRFTDVLGARVAALTAALAPSALILWGTKTRGGFIELVVVGTWALLLSADLLSAEKRPRRSIFILGLLLGIGWWMNNQIAFYLLPIGLVVPSMLVVHYGFRETLRLSGLGLASFLLGSLPFWYANIFGDPQWATFEVLFGQPSGGSTWEHLSGFFLKAMPIILGARRFWSEVDVFPGASLVAAVCYGVVVLVALGFRRAQTLRRNTRAAGLLLVLFFISTALIFSFSSFGWLSLAPRYLLPLYSVVPIAVGVAVAKLWRRFGSAAGGLLLCAVLGLNLASNYWGGLALAGQPALYRGERVAHDHTELYRWLAQEGYTHFHTNYWIGYRAAFETDEAVTFTRFGRPRSLRIAEYEALGVGQPEVVVAVPREAETYMRQLEQFGMGFRTTQLGKYVAIDRIARHFPVGVPLANDRFQLRSELRPDWVPNMTDGSLETRWGSGTQQQAGMTLSVEFPLPTVVSGIQLDLGQFVHDAPRRLRIEAVLAGGESKQLADTLGTKLYFDLHDQEFGEVPEQWLFTFSPIEVKALRLVQLENAAVFDWSIAELTILTP
ncbi:MAG: glycosyltransferase family 39 protein [Bdellovibrionales bacterium]|nr:glycosyltransferase family 39 protein [Bdellovibrionales bacterium]